MEHLLGRRIATYRERLEMSPEDLAKSSGVDLVVINAIEAGQVYPALGVLIRISRALGQRLGTFMDDQFREDPLIVRQGERTEEIAQEMGETPELYRYFPLGRGKTDRHMEPFYVEIDPQQEHTPSSHEGEEFIVVISGEIDLAYGKKHFHLKAGDSMYYNSIVPHYVGTIGTQQAKLYAVMFMPF